MISDLDNLLRQLFISESEEIKSDFRVHFQLSDENWLTSVVSLTMAAKLIHDGDEGTLFNSEGQRLCGRSIP